ncbi:MAG: DUF2017 family protein [Candidatus Leucobacter sulfamidivorax]|nr:DUF2017 family protein [Candidatus Leucobacter sulfamidivorax]
MRLLPLPDGSLRLRLDIDEARLLDQLTGQLIDLLQSHSRTALDPDPLFASLEVGGSREPPNDPALARLFPDAYETGDDAAQFRSLTEQGLLNRKLHDALAVTSELALGRPPAAVEESDAEGDGGGTVDALITTASLAPWVRTLTALRLAIAARIGLDAESDHPRLLADEETRGTVLVYDWLGAILDSLLRMLTPE